MLVGQRWTAPPGESLQARTEALGVFLCLHKVSWEAPSSMSPCPKWKESEQVQGPSQLLFSSPPWLLHTSGILALEKLSCSLEALDRTSTENNSKMPTQGLDGKAMTWGF